MARVVLMVLLLICLLFLVVVELNCNGMAVLIVNVYEDLLF